MSPTQRSLAYLRAQGWLCAVVEKFVRFPPPGHRVDLFGIADIEAVKPGFPTVYLQTTAGDGGGFAARRKKIKEHPNYAMLRDVRRQIVLHGWAKRGPRGKRKTWTLREEWL